MRYNLLIQTKGKIAQSENIIMFKNTNQSMLAIILRNVAFSCLCFIFILLGGLALMKVLSISLSIPELRMANQFTFTVVAQLIFFTVVGAGSVLAAIKSESFRKQ